jgi:ribosomal protein S18 acetylase RimI-like enzyme
MTLIREASPADHKIIVSFQVKMALETENIRLDPDIVEAGVHAVFTNPSNGIYYIAEEKGVILGCLLTTFEWSDWRNGRILWIQSVYILPEYRKRGHFKSLYNYIKQLVEAEPEFKGIRLYVDKSNEQARIVYRNCGMDGEHYQIFEWIKPC